MTGSGVLSWIHALEVSFWLHAGLPPALAPLCSLQSEACGQNSALCSFLTWKSWQGASAGWPATCGGPPASVSPGEGHLRESEGKKFSSSPRTRDTQARTQWEVLRAAQGHARITAVFSQVVPPQLLLRDAEATASWAKRGPQYPLCPLQRGEMEACQSSSSMPWHGAQGGPAGGRALPSPPRRSEEHGTVGDAGLRSLCVFSGRLARLLGS